MDIFNSAKQNDVTRISELLRLETNIDDQDDFGRSALHICCTYGCVEAAGFLIGRGACLTLQDYESGWTPLHRSMYFGHLKITLLLLKANAKIGDELDVTEWNLDIYSKLDAQRTLSNYKFWKSTIDHDGHSPLDLLSLRLSPWLKNSSRLCTGVSCFGKSDFYLGIVLPNAEFLSRPRFIPNLNDMNVISVSASKYHSAAVTKEGTLYTWGVGRGGRLGHGNHDICQLPSPVLSFVGKVVKSIAAAENHMLAIVDNGELYSWGSNGFGQLGQTSSGQNGQANSKNDEGGNSPVNQSQSQSSQTTYHSPKKIEKLRQHVVQAVAAGATHSICLTADGKLWGWGSNKHGQLGKSKGKIINANGSSTPLELGVIDNKNINKPDSKIIQIAASKFSTLILCTLSSSLSNQSSQRLGSISEVWQWGQGISYPIKVHFKSKINHSNHTRKSHDDSFSKSWSNPTGTDIVNIVQIAAGNSHYVATTSSGHVYTWGLGTDQLGHGDHSSSSHISEPEVLSSLLPENGGGKVVYINCGGDRTCAITDCGDLFTWGICNEMGALGHGNRIYQPVPKRVIGIKRAVAVAAGENHTVVLTSASVPPLPFNTAAPLQSTSLSLSSLSSQNIRVWEPCLDDCPGSDEGGEIDEDAVTVEDSPKTIPITTDILSLKNLCEISVSSQVNLENAMRILSYAESFDCPDLAKFVIAFVLRNLDAIIVQQLSLLRGGKSDAWLDLNILIADIEESIAKFCVSKEDIPMVTDSFYVSADEVNSAYKTIVTKELLSQEKEEATTAYKKNEFVIPTDVTHAKRLVKGFRKKISKLCDIEVKLKVSGDSGKELSFLLSKKESLQVDLDATLQILNKLEMEDAKHPTNLIFVSESVQNAEDASTNNDAMLSPIIANPVIQSVQKDSAEIAMSQSKVVTSNSKQKKLKFISFDQFESMVKTSECKKSEIPIPKLMETPSKKNWQTEKASPQHSISLIDIMKDEVRAGSVTDTEGGGSCGDPNGGNRRSRGDSLSVIEGDRNNTSTLLSNFLPNKLTPVKDSELQLRSAGTKSITKASSATKSPWSKSIEKTNVNSSESKPTQRGVNVCCSSYSPESSKALNLREIQAEEERERELSYIKDLQGNYNPWFLNRRSSRINSFGEVMSSQKIEQVVQSMEASTNTEKKAKNAKKSRAKTKV